MLLHQSKLNLKDVMRLSEDCKDEYMCVTEVVFYLSGVSYATLFCYFICVNNFSICFLVLVFVSHYQHLTYCIHCFFPLRISVFKIVKFSHIGKLGYFVNIVFIQVSRVTANLWVWTAPPLCTPYPKSQVH